MLVHRAPRSHAQRSLLKPSWRQRRCEHIADSTTTWAQAKTQTVELPRPPLDFSHEAALKERPWLLDSSSCLEHGFHSLCHTIAVFKGASVGLDGRTAGCGPKFVIKPVVPKLLEHERNSSTLEETPIVSAAARLGEWAKLAHKGVGALQIVSIQKHSRG
jgi:hypothetical protein